MVEVDRPIVDEVRPVDLLADRGRDQVLARDRKVFENDRCLASIAPNIEIDVGQLEETIRVRLGGPLVPSPRAGSGATEGPALDGERLGNRVVEAHLPLPAERLASMPLSAISSITSSHSSIVTTWSRRRGPCGRPYDHEGAERPVQRTRPDRRRGLCTKYARRAPLPDACCQRWRSSPRFWISKDGRIEMFGGACASCGPRSDRGSHAIHRRPSFSADPRPSSPRPTKT